MISGELCGGAVAVAPIEPATQPYIMRPFRPLEPEKSVLWRLVEDVRTFFREEASARNLRELLANLLRTQEVMSDPVSETAS
jgi:hypothetical protein